MKTISFDGLVTRREYWKNFTLGVVLLFGFSLVSLAVLSIFDAQETNASALSQIMATALFACFCFGLILWLVWVFSLIVRRARDAGNAVAWGVVAVLTPLGFLTIGFLPTHAKNK